MICEGIPNNTHTVAKSIFLLQVYPSSFTFHPSHKGNYTATALITQFLPRLSNETDGHKPFMFQKSYEGHLKVLEFNDASVTEELDFHHIIADSRRNCVDYGGIGGLGIV